MLGAALPTPADGYLGKEHLAFVIAFGDALKELIEGACQANNAANCTSILVSGIQVTVRGSGPERLVLNSCPWALLQVELHT